MIAMMIEVPESHITTLDETSVFELEKLNLQDEQRYKKIQGEKDLCYYRLSGDNTQIETSYYIGINWIVEKHIPIYIRPKLNTQQCEIDYLSMLMEALEETENICHLDGLLSIDFNKPAISISQREDILSPFLIVQYLQILKIIVRKGLKKAYYLRQDNLDSKIKGKVLITQNIKQNILNGDLTHNVCQYQEYGVNCNENRLLKKAFMFACAVLQQYTDSIKMTSISQTAQYIRTAFLNVSDSIEIEEVKSIHTNPIHKEYVQAIKLAKLILRKYGYNIARTRLLHETPPFWIDMSKLFELFVFKKLREQFSNREVKYHLKAHYRELDFILRPDEGLSPFIIDAKYKPRYKKQSIDIEDIRQISGYARLEKVYKELGITDFNKNIRCLIIYSNQNCPTDLPQMRYNEHWLLKENGYVNIYKLGISLPQI